MEDELISPLNSFESISELAEDSSADFEYTSDLNESLGREYPIEVDTDLTDAEIIELTREAESNGVIENADELLSEALEEMEVTPIVPEPVEPIIYDNLPVNSDTLVINEITSRFSSADWAEKIRTKRVLLAGIGGIGSYVAYLLSRLDIEYLYMIDADIVESANLSGQMFNMNNVGQTKVSAMVNNIALFSNFYKTSAQCSRFTRSSFALDVMICGFDNMMARRDLYHVWKSRVEGYKTLEEKADCLFIDGRLAAEEYQVFCIKGDDYYNMARYERDFLFTDAEAEATVCSYKQTSFMANQIASTMINLFVNYVANQCAPLFDRDLPFYTTYDGITMYFKTEA